MIFCHFPLNGNFHFDWSIIVINVCDVDFCFVASGEILLMMVQKGQILYPDQKP